MCIRDRYVTACPPPPFHHKLYVTIWNPFLVLFSAVLFDPTFHKGLAHSIWDPYLLEIPFDQSFHCHLVHYHFTHPFHIYLVLYYLTSFPLLISAWSFDPPPLHTATKYFTIWPPFLLLSALHLPLTLVAHSSQTRIVRKVAGQPLSTNRLTKRIAVWSPSPRFPLLLSTPALLSDFHFYYCLVDYNGNSVFTTS